MINFEEDGTVYIVEENTDQMEGKGPYRRIGVFIHERTARTFVEQIPDPWGKERAWEDYGSHSSYGHLNLIPQATVGLEITDEQLRELRRTSGLAKITGANLTTEELEALDINPKEP